MSLGKLTLQGGLWGGASSAVQQGLQFGFFIFLAWLLNPAMFGLMAMALVALDILVLVAGWGLVSVLIRQQQPTHRIYQQAFWWLLIMGGIMAAGMASLGYPLAQMYAEPQVQWLMMALSPLCLLQNLGVVQEARLRQTFQYRAMAVRNMTGVLLGGLCGVVAA
ncbi:MAG: oligosaccharide flippase family protein, partial [Alphaproteobacteria bacterium]